MRGFGDKKRKSLAILSLALLMLILTACGQYTPTQNTRSFLINEVFLGAGNGTLQWVEIINNGDAGSLSGWTLTTTKGSLDLSRATGTATGGGQITPLTGGGTVPPGAMLVIASNPSEFKTRYAALSPQFVAIDGSSVLGNLDPKNDIIVLKSAGIIADQVGWGDPSAQSKARTDLGITSPVNLEVATPDENKTIGRTPAVGARDPENPGYFTIHNSISAAGAVPQPRDRYISNFFISNLTDYIGITGGLLLWLVFIMVGLIARRFQELAQQKTYWEYLLIAPIGILIYAVVTMIAFSFTPRQSYGDIPEWRFMAFLALLLSGIACLYVVNIFRLIAKNILESE
jgi:Lamin Tail Domain